MMGLIRRGLNRMRRCRLQGYCTNQVWTRGLNVVESTNHHNQSVQYVYAL